MGILTAREIFSVTLEELNNIAGDAGLYCHALFIRCFSSYDGAFAASAGVSIDPAVSCANAAVNSA